MKKAKIVFWLILIALIGLTVYQNIEFFQTEHEFVFNPYVTEIQHSPLLPIGVWFLACFAIGFLLAYFFGMMERFRLNRTIKELTAKTNSHLDIIAQLRKALESKQQPAAAGTTPAAEMEAGVGEPEPAIEIQSQKE